MNDEKEGQKKYYCCNHCGFSETNRADWCDMGCGRDYNGMIDVTKNIVSHGKAMFEKGRQDLDKQLLPKAEAVLIEATKQCEKITRLKERVAELVAENNRLDLYYGKQLQALEARNKEQEKALKNCYLLAAREFHKTKDELWGHVLRFCKEGGESGFVLRGELESRKALTDGDIYKIIDEHYGETLSDSGMEKLALAIHAALPVSKVPSVEAMTKAFDGVHVELDESHHLTPLSVKMLHGALNLFNQRGGEK